MLSALKTKGTMHRIPTTSTTQCLPASRDRQDSRKILQLACKHAVNRSLMV